MTFEPLSRKKSKSAAADRLRLNAKRVWDSEIRIGAPYGPHRSLRQRLQFAQARLPGRKGVWGDCVGCIAGNP